MTNLESDAMAVMEQIHMAESRHMQMGALCSYLLQYPDMTIETFLLWQVKKSEKKKKSWGITNNGTINRNSVFWCIYLLGFMCCQIP